MINLKDNLADFLKVLADPTRLAIMDSLKDEREKSVTEIENETGKSQSSVSQQLKILINAKILTVRRKSRSRLYKIRDPQIFKILSTINTFISKINQDKIEELVETDITGTLF